MEMVYWICAVVGGTLIVCQFLVTLLGVGGHHDAGGGHHDVGGHDIGEQPHDAAGRPDHEAGHESQSAWFFSLLTFRTLSAAFAFFGLTGLACLRAEVDFWTGVALAIAAGGSALFVVAWLMQMMIKLNVDGTVRIERAIGARGTVYLMIPAAKAGAGKVHVNFLNRTVEYKAVTLHEQLPTGAKIVVVSVVSADTVEVAPAVETERTNRV